MRQLYSKLKYKRIYDLLGKVDFIVTDAGLEISALHASEENKVVEELCLKCSYRNRFKK